MLFNFHHYVGLLAAENDKLNKEFSKLVQTMDTVIAVKEEELERRTTDLDSRKICLDKHENDLAAREAALIRREAAVGQIRELAATRLAAKKVLEERVAQAEAAAAAARKELSDLKSKLRNPLHPAFVTSIQEALKT